MCQKIMLVAGGLLSLKRQWCQLLKYLDEGIVDGYLIAATYMIDAAQPQARWVRDFIAAN